MYFHRGLLPATSWTVTHKRRDESRSPHFPISSHYSTLALVASKNSFCASPLLFRKHTMFARRESSSLHLFLLLPVVYVAGSTASTSALTTISHATTPIATTARQVAFTTAAPLPRGGSGGISEGGGSGNCPVSGTPQTRVARETQALTISIA